MEDIIVPQQHIPIGYHKFSLELPLVDEVIDPTSSLVNVTLILESKVKLAELMSSPPDPTLSLESVNIEVVPLTQSPSCPSLLVESELKPAEVFVVNLDCSTQE